MQWIIGIVVLLIAGVAYLAMKGRNSSAKRPAPGVTTRSQDSVERQSYNAYSIIPGKDCCQAVADLADKRFLAEKFVRLPIEACDRMDECSCTFKHHSDRRDEDDRRNPVGSLSTKGHIGMKRTNRREAKDRRAE